MNYNYDNRMNDTLTAIKPLYYISNISGMASYKPKLINGKRVYIKNKKIYFGLVIFAIQFVASLYVLANLSYYFKFKEPIVKIIFLFQTICGVINNLIMFTTFWLNSDNYLVILNKLEEVDREMKLNNMFIDNTKIRNSSLKLHSIELLIMLIKIILIYFVGTNTTISTHFAIFYISITFLQSWLQINITAHFCVFLALLQRRFETINENIEEIVQYINYNSNAHENIENCVKTISSKFLRIRINLCNILRDINKIFFVSILFYIAMLYVVILTQMYKMTTEIVQYEFSVFKYRLTMALTIAILAVFRLYIICNSCAKLNKAVSKLK